MKPIVLTYVGGAELCHPKVLRWSLSMRKWGWEHAIIHAPHWKGFGVKLKALAEEMAKRFAAGYTHAISVDAFDVVALGPPEYLPPPTAPLWLATEAACWPDASKAALHPDTDSYWRYAHSPFTLDLSKLDLIEADRIEPWGDDQNHLMDIFLRGDPQVALDTQCQVVQSIAHCHPWTDYFEVEGDRILNKKTGSRPLFAHGNGGADMDWLPGGLIDAG